MGEGAVVAQQHEQWRRKNMKIKTNVNAGKVQMQDFHFTSVMSKPSA
jgi:hypothetical protein